MLGNLYMPPQSQVVVKGVKKRFSRGWYNWEEKLREARRERLKDFVFQWMHSLPGSCLLLSGAHGSVLAVVNPTCSWAQRSRESANEKDEAHRIATWWTQMSRKSYQYSKGGVQLLHSILLGRYTLAEQRNDSKKSLHRFNHACRGAPWYRHTVCLMAFWSLSVTGS